MPKAEIMRILFGLLLMTVLAAACDNVVPTVTPERALSGPTLEASPTVLPFLPSAEPTMWVNQGQNDPTAAALPSGGDLPPLVIGTSDPGSAFQSIQVTSEDGTQLRGDLYPNLEGQRVPGVLMLAPGRAAWLDLPLRLQARGITVLSMDLRSEAAPDDLAAGDFRASLVALSEAGTVDPGRIAVIGAETGADLALAGCAANLLCDALVMISPLNREVSLGAIPAYNPRPLFLLAGDGDALFTVADALRGTASGPLRFEAVSGATRGTALLLAQPALTDAVIAWLEEQLANAAA